MDLNGAPAAGGGPPWSRLSRALLGLGVVACAGQVAFVRTKTPDAVLTAAMWVSTIVVVAAVLVATIRVRPWGRVYWTAASVIVCLMPAGLAIRRLSQPQVQTALASEVGVVEVLYVIGYLLAALAFFGLLSRIRQRPEPISAVDGGLVFNAICALGFAALLDPLVQQYGFGAGLVLQAMFLVVDALLAALTVRLWITTTAQANRALRLLLLAVMVFVANDLLASYFTINTGMRSAWDGVYLGLIVVSLSLVAAAWWDPTAVNRPAGTRHAGRLGMGRAALTGLVVVPVVAVASALNTWTSVGEAVILGALIAAIALLSGLRGVLLVGAFRTAVARSDLLRAAGADLALAATQADVLAWLGRWSARLLPTEAITTSYRPEAPTPAEGSADGSGSPGACYRASAFDGTGHVVLEVVADVPLDPLDWSAARRMVDHAGDAGLQLALERRRASADERARTSELMAGSLDLVVLVDPDGRIREALGAVEQVVAGGENLAAGRDVLELFVAPDDVAALLAAPAPARSRVSAQLAGSDTMVEVTVMTLSSGGATVSVHDITERVRLEHALNHRATHDELTGLLNRPGFEVAVVAAESSFTERGTPFGIVLIDIDEFQVANDALGHDAGDAILIEVARRIRQAVPETCVVARCGGDEFAVLAHGDEEHVRTAIDSAMATFALPLHLADLEFSARASAGVVLGSVAMASGGRSLQAADLALVEAKAEVNGRIGYFRPALRDAVVDRMAAAGAVAAAARAGEFHFDYQPIVASDSGRAVSVEALMRWDHGGRWGSPETFIPVAESLGELTAIFRSALLPALEQLRQWRVAHPRLTMTFNAHEAVLDDDLARWFPLVAAQAGVPLSALSLELTERSLVPARATGSLAKLRDAGLRVLIDDFGTGWSNLSYLSGLPVTGLKIAREVAFGPGGEVQPALISAAVSLAAAFDLDVIAEGVETAEQVAAVRALGVPKIQGFFFARPMPQAELTRWLAQHAE